MAVFRFVFNFIFLLVAVACTSSANAQVNIRVEMNKQLFLPGDTIEVDALVPIWQSTAQNGTLNLYLENQEGPSWRLRYPIVNGKGGGSIILPDSIAHGLYTAYFALQNDFFELHGQLQEGEVKDGRVNMVLVSEKQEFYSIDLTVGKDNRFRSGPILFADTARAYFSPIKRKKRNNLDLQLEVPLDSTFTSITDTIIYFTVGNKALPAPKTPFDKKQFATGRDGTLAMAEVVGKRKTALDNYEERWVSTMFKAPDAITFDGITSNQFYGWLNVFEWLMGKVGGLIISRGAEPLYYSASWRGYNTLLFLDEMPADSKTISLLQNAEIAMVRVFQPPYQSGSFSGSGGAIAVYSKMGKTDLNTPRNQYRLQGYTPHTYILPLPSK